MDENPYQSPQVPDPQQVVLNIPRDGKHCPACGEDIGIWPIFSAVVPGRCRCPHCRTKLSWTGAYSATLVMVVLTLAICGAGAALAFKWLGYEEPTHTAAVFAALAFLPIIAISWVGAMFQRNRSILRKL